MNELPEDVRLKVCNGMGPRGGWFFQLLVWVLRALGPGRAFEEASNRHDVAYACGGSEEDRRRADDVFLLDMAGVWRRHRGLSLWALRWCAHKAHTAVDELGDEVFCYRPKRLSLAELVDEVRSA